MAGKTPSPFLIRQYGPENRTSKPGAARRAAPITYHGKIRYKPDITK
jgi:hypothetical protein